ncbi:DUF6456 domain-containing protein [Rhizobiaceae bacterium]|nr:DUF6456 domain-containing protein [Rhizobiaceae bacterium]
MRAAITDGPLTVGPSDHFLRLLVTGKSSARQIVTLDELSKAFCAGLSLQNGNAVSVTHQTAAYLARYDAAPDDAFVAQHRSMRRTSITVDGTTSDVRVNDNESPLFRLRNARDRNGTPWLSSEAFEAGERLRRDFDRAHLEPAITSRWNPGGTRGGGVRNGEVNLAHSALAARDCLPAMRMTLGPELSGVALDICGYLKDLEQAKRERIWPLRFAKLMLRTALDMLAGHYGTVAGITPQRAPPS